MVKFVCVNLSTESLHDSQSTVGFTELGKRFYCPWIRPDVSFQPVNSFPAAKWTFLLLYAKIAHAVASMNNRKPYLANLPCKGLIEMGTQFIMVRTRAVIFDENGKVLVQHHSSSDPDFYRLPGGGVRLREKIEDSVVREIREEAGLNVRVDRLLWVRDFLDQFPYHSIELFFLATVVGGEFKPTPEAENIELLFVTPEELDKRVFYPKAFIPKLKLLRDNRSWIEQNPYFRSVN